MRAIEWPTLLLAIGIYAGWVALTLGHAALPDWVILSLGGALVAWHSSLQHETIHGHPTRWGGLNRLVAGPPLLLWLPYARFRTLHLVHHDEAQLTDPARDPESAYWPADRWHRLHPFGRAAVELQTTLLGRLVLGPVWSVGRFLWSERRSGDRTAWLRHAVQAAAVVAWLELACGFALLDYLLLVVLPGTALLQLRSFAEHRAAADPRHRTAIVEGGGLLALLFLFNNLHVAHHARPDLPWYRLPAFWRRHRAELLQRNGGLVYSGYGAVVARFLLQAHDSPVHPAHAPSP